ncbi:hypothetical protein U14_02632 [Candidatus Moduliflexus flocculans]|uniref:Uncharacterized protein n=1 Tax=Candidatus Moduliflexus flocculans TaxID=1499966 RepID=A0A081BLX2_9BACT|nr:hypothetical protein U14_02632 [Candidatus Moduliflexus flocculans]
MKCFIRLQWVSFVKMLMIASFSIAILSACGDDDNDSPTTPTNNVTPASTPTPEPTPTSGNAICEFASSCPRGGSIQVCLNPDQTGFYLLSDGTKFPEGQEEEAASYCVTKL